MTDFTLSGLAVGNAETFDVVASQLLDGSLLFNAFIGDGTTDTLLVGTPTLTGQATPTVVGMVVGTPNLVLSSNVTGGYFVAGEAFGLSLFYHELQDDDLTNIQEIWHPFTVNGSSLLEGGTTIDAVVDTMVVGNSLLEGSAQFDAFIGDGVAITLTTGTPTLTGEPDPLQDGGSPPYVAFNGTPDYIYHPTVTDGDLRGGANFSCVVVFDPEYVNNPNTGTGTLVGKHDPGGTDHGWFVEYDETTGFINVTVSSNAAGSNRAERSTDTTDIRVRTVFVFTWDSTSLELYVAGSSEQGAQTDTGTPGAMVASTAQFALGAHDTLGTATNFYRGAIHCVYLFDDVLTSGEVGTIDQSGMLPAALIDGNLVVAWRPDEIRGQVSGFELTKWLDNIGSRDLVRSAAGLICFPGIVEHARFRADDWNMDFANSEIAGVSLDQNLASTYVLSTSSTNSVEDGGFREWVVSTGEAPPEISSGYRDNGNDITIIWGVRFDDTSAADPVFLTYRNFQILYDSGTRDLWLYEDTGASTTRHEYGIDVPGMEAAVPDGPGTVFAFRYNSQLDQFTLFINGTKMVETGTTVTGPNLAGTGILFCDDSHWAAVNPSSLQADRRAAFVFGACLPDSLLFRVLNNLAPEVFGWPSDDRFPLGVFFRAIQRVAPAPDLDYGHNFIVYPFVDSFEERDTATPPASRYLAYPTGSGTVELTGQPLDGEQFTISDGTTTLTFEIEISGGITGDVSVNLGGSVSATLTNIQTAINASALDITAGAPFLFSPDGGPSIGYVRLTQDDLNDGELPLTVVDTKYTIPGGQIRATGPYRVYGPVGSVGLLDGQPNDGDQFSITDGTTTVVFEFDSGGGVGPGNTTVTIAGTNVLTMDNLVTAINASALTITAAPTESFNRFEITAIDAVQTQLTHAASTDRTDYANRTEGPILIPVNVSGNLVATPNLAQPRTFEESLPSHVSNIVYGSLDSQIEAPYVTNPYAVLEPEDLTTGGGGLPPFINPAPVILSVTENGDFIVTAIAEAGPTDAGDVRSWWEIELVSGDPQFNLRIDEQDNNFSIFKSQADTFPIPTGQNWEDLRIRFVIQSQLDPDQVWFSLYTRMTGEGFNNGETEVIILPGVGAPEAPPTIELEISTEAQAFVVEEEEAGAARQLSLSNRSRYKLTRIFINTAVDPRIDDRNEDGLEFGLLSVLDDFLDLGTNVRTHTITSADRGFLDAVAVKFYGAGFEDFWWVIAYANNILDPDAEMFVGQQLKIPSREVVTSFLARKPAAGGV
jgi:hypothetical protein